MLNVTLVAVSGKGISAAILASTLQGMLPAQDGTRHIRDRYPISQVSSGRRPS